MLLPHLRKLIPPHQTFLDLFGGGGTLALADGGPGVWNDVNSHAVNFFRVLRDESKGHRLIEGLRHTPYAREEYFDAVGARKMDWAEADDVERARLWFILVNVGFTHQIDCDSFRVAISPREPRAVYNHIERLEEVARHIRRNIIIENLDFRRAMELYGHGEELLIYADPPYISDNPNTLDYEKPFTLSDHYDLIQLLNRTDAQVLLFGYETELYRDMLPSSRWKLHTIDRKAQVGNGSYDEREIRTEHIWRKVNNSHHVGLFAL